MSGQRIPRAEVHQRRLSARLTLPGLALILGLALGAAGAVALHQEAGASGPDVVGAQAPGPVDIGFSQDMIVHHQQAITMVDAMGSRGGTRVGSIGHTIRTEQLGEIGMMSGWLALWGAPPLSSTAPMAWMSDHAMGAGEAMPGMASRTDLDALARLTGGAAAKRFLELMIRHHEGGIAMATYAGAHAATEVVRAAAERMILDEREEITLMAQLLAMA